MANDYVQATDLETFIGGFELNDTDGQGPLTTAQADSVIQIIEGELNGVISSLGFTVPVTNSASPHSYKYIRSIAIQGILALIQSDIHALTDDTEGSREQAFWRRYSQAIKRLEDTGGSALVDLDPIDGDGKGNVAPAITSQETNTTADIEKVLRLRDLTRLRHYEAELAKSDFLGRGGIPLRGLTSFGGTPLL